MYSWDEDTTSWYGKKGYKYGAAGADRRRAASKRAKAHGPRTYKGKRGPQEKVIDPKKSIATNTRNPLIIAVDVTGSMSSWPAEIFDRLPLLYNTLVQYRPDLEVCFAAIGDAYCDQWPLQVTTFASGFDLEQLLGSIYGEGRGGDAPESYGLFAHWVNTHVTIPGDLEDQPFLIVYGDITMHEKVQRSAIKNLLGGKNKTVDAIEAWQKVSKTWNTWFLRRRGGSRGDQVDKQWGRAIGEQKILPIEDEPRAVDYAMGLIARSWGHFDDFKKNMRARQPEKAVDKLAKPIAMMCPACGGPIPTDASGLFRCNYCKATLKL